MTRLGVGESRAVPGCYDATMPVLTVAFANICQGLICQGKKNDRDVFSKHWPSAYRDLYASIQPDVMCLAEVPMDDEQGNSKFLTEFSKQLGNFDFQADVHEKSWLIEGMYYGNAILSRYRLQDYRTLKLPNPRFEIDNPDGSHWVLHDKTVQGATISVGALPIHVFNLHYFAFHRFKHDMSEPELRPSRTAFVNQLRLADGHATIVTGDFNNGNNELEVAYPELFEDNLLTDAVKFGPDEIDEFYSSTHQLDHILYTKRDFMTVRTEVIRDGSDHRGVLAALALQG